MTKPPFCTKCRYHQHYYGFHRCHHPEVREVNPVDGGFDIPFCNHLRKWGKCGKSGALFSRGVIPRWPVSNITVVGLPLLLIVIAVIFATSVAVKLAHE